MGCSKKGAQNNMNFFSPAEICENCCKTGKAKSSLALYKLIILGILAGAYIAFAANAASTAGAGWPAEWAKSGLNSMCFAATFTVGLILVVIAGSELFTGNTMFLMVSCLDKQTSWGALAKNWTVVFIANFIGSMILVAIVYYANAPFGADALSAYGAKAVAVANNKLSYTWDAAFFRAIGCNWLVCLAVWLGMSAKDIPGKVLGIFFPIYTFVLSGFEHSVANMFFIPMGLVTASAAPEMTATALGMSVADVSSVFTWGNFITANLIPVTLGNIVGGAIFVGFAYWLVYVRKKKVVTPVEAAPSENKPA